MKKRDAENLNPTPEAVMAMCIWGKRYSEWGGGSMDFWHSLSKGEQRSCMKAAEQFRKADRRHNGQDRRFD